MNKYEKWYHELCDRGQHERNLGYTERHHIIPECFFKNRKRKGKSGWLDGDANDIANLTNLTEREHKLAHYLLVKIHKNDKRAYYKMLKAFEMVHVVNQNQDKKRHFSSRQLSDIRAERAKIQSESMCGENNPNYGRRWTDEEKEAQRQKVTGNQLTTEQYDKMMSSLNKRKELGIKRKGYSNEYKELRSEMYSGEGNPRFGVEVSDETRKKIGDKIRGRKQTEEEKKARSIANMGKTKPKKLCEHCGQMVAVNGYARWHGTNCKKKV